MMIVFSLNDSYDKDDFNESQELLDIVASWHKSPQPINSDHKPEVIQIKFSDDLANYIGFIQLDATHNHDL